MTPPEPEKEPEEETPEKLTEDLPTVGKKRTAVVDGGIGVESRIENLALDFEIHQSGTVEIQRDPGARSHRDRAGIGNDEPFVGDCLTQ